MCGRVEPAQLDGRNPYLMNNPVPCKPGIVDDNMDLAVAELGCLVDESLDVLVVENVSDDCNGAAGLGAVDGVDYAVCFLYNPEKLVLD